MAVRQPLRLGMARVCRNTQRLQGVMLNQT
jgi:hypothetical protein